MGGEPRFALNLVFFPDDQLPLEVLDEILAGSARTCAEAGVLVVGGHSVRDAEVKFGLSVTGEVAPGRAVDESHRDGRAGARADQGDRHRRDRSGDQEGRRDARGRDGRGDHVDDARSTATRRGSVTRTASPRRPTSPASACSATSATSCAARRSGARIEARRDPAAPRRDRCTCARSCAPRQQGEPRVRRAEHVRWADGTPLARRGATTAERIASCSPRSRATRRPAAACCCARPRIARTRSSTSCALQACPPRRSAS